MRISKRVGTLVAVAALVGVGLFAMPRPAEAYWVWRGGVQVWVPAPVVVAPPPPVVYYAPRPYYAPPPVVVVQPRRIWVPAHWRGGYWVPGHWA